MTETNKNNGYARNVRDLLESIFRHKEKGLLFLLIVALSTLTVLAFTPSEYTSMSKLIVRRGREGVLWDPAVSAGRILPLHKTWESEINTELEILGSRELMVEVAQRLGDDLFLQGDGSFASGMLKPLRLALAPARRLLIKLRKGLAGRLSGAEQTNGVGQQYRVVKMIENHLCIEAPSESDIITVSYTAASPELARDVVSQLVDIYLDRRIDVHRVPGAHQFFGQQTETLLSELKVAEDSISAIKNRAGVSSLEESRRTLQAAIESIRTQQLQNESALASANARVATLRAMLSKKAPSSSMEKNSALLDPTERLELQATLRNDEIKQAALIAEANEADRQLAQLRQELADVNTLDGPIRKLEREQDLLEERYRKYYQDEEQSRINEELEIRKISNVNIVQNATLPAKADPSGKLLKFFAALFMGMIGSVAISFGADYLDPTLHSTADVDERLGLRTLLELPHLRHGALPCFIDPDVRKKRVRGRVMHWRETSGVDDYFQELLFKILSVRESAPSGPFVIGITSSFSGEGVSSVAANLANAFARDDRFENILLLDVTQQAHPAETAKRMASAPFTYQHISPMENDGEPASAGRSTARVEEMLNQARRHGYKAVVVDLSPVCPGGTAIRIAADLDCVILVIEAEQTPWRDALRTAEFLTESRSNLCGVILNQKILAMPEWLYRKL